MSIVQTVLGEISPEELGVTLPHEHLLIDIKPLFAAPDEASQNAMAYSPVTMDRLGWIRPKYAINLDNMGLYDEEVSTEEVIRYKWAGGASLVDASSGTIGRDPLGLARISRATGLNIIMGSGYYVDSFHPLDMDEKKEEEIVEEIVRDITVGVNDSGIRSGIIGEIGCSWPLTKNERKVLRAAAGAQGPTGAAITIHPGRHPTVPMEILRIIEEAGGDLKRTIMGHLDRTVFDFDTLRELAATGCYLEFDLFGLESSRYPLAPIDMPNDGRRIDLIMQLIEEGHLNQVMISHDIAWKTSLLRYGGYGYAHILQVVVPMMRKKGVKEEQVKAILIENPKRILAIG